MWQLLAGFRVTPLCPAFFCPPLRAQRRSRLTAVDASRRRFLGLRRPAGAAVNTLRPDFVPRLDPGRCNACDACVRVCGSGALVLDVETPAYRIDPARCDGCGLCVDVCNRDAVALAAVAGAAPESFALESALCPVCGVAYRTPAGNGSARCQVCARKGVAKNQLRVRE